MKSDSALSKQSNKRSMSDVWFVLFGIYLLVGAGYSFISAKWFPGFPPQLDVFMIFGHPLGAYVEGMIAASLGAGLIYFPWRAASKAKHPHTNSEENKKGHH